MARTDKFTEEVRLASASNNRLEWLLGGFYTHETSLLQQIGAVFGAGLTPLPVNIATARIHSRYQEYAAFGDLTYHLTDRFDVTGGLSLRQKSSAIRTGRIGPAGHIGPIADLA